jgi:hypothetical protein
MPELVPVGCPLLLTQSQGVQDTIGSLLAVPCPCQRVDPLSSGGVDSQGLMIKDPARL